MLTSESVTKRRWITCRAKQLHGTAKQWKKKKGKKEKNASYNDIL
jgi:hypothetical protein